MIRRTEESFHVVFIDLVLVEIQSFQPLQFRFFLPQGEKVFQQEMLFLICVSIMAICAGKKNADATLDFLNLHQQNGNLH